jgi:hypothetical protein
VSSPVAITSAVAEPDAMLVPMKTRLGDASGSSPGGRPGADFSTGADSPVSAPWATYRSRTASSRQSAGTMSPADRASTSPGTSRPMGSSACGAARAAPPAGRRSTVAVLPTSARRPSAAWCARPSCTKRMPVLSATIAPITAVALRSELLADTAASALSSRLKGLL